MGDPIAIPTDLGVYLKDPDIDVARATLMLQLAQDLCETILTPLPATALGRVLAVAARAFANVTSAQDVNLGSGHIGYGASAVGGLYLSRADKSALRLLAGRGGAFSIDPTPADAGQGLPPWDQNVTWLEGVPFAEDQRR
jgi:hypothetical protein